MNVELKNVMTTQISRAAACELRMREGSAEKLMRVFFFCIFCLFFIKILGWETTRPTLALDSSLSLFNRPCDMLVQKQFLTNFNLEKLSTEATVVGIVNKIRQAIHAHWKPPSYTQELVKSRMLIDLIISLDNIVWKALKS